MAIFIVVLIVTIAFGIYSNIYKKHIFDDVDYKCRFKNSEVYQGEEIVFIEEVSNAKVLPISWLKAEITTSKYLSFSEKCSAVTYNTRFVSSSYTLGGNKSVEREWKLSATKRGVFSIENVVLNSCDIFGLNEVSLPVKNVSARVTVLPTEVDTPDLNDYIRGIVGDFQTKRSLLTDAFSMRGIREYTGHERLNRIHWKNSAKQCKLMAIEENYSIDMNVVIYLYLQEHCEETLAEKTLSTACTLAVRLSERGIPTKLDTNCGMSTVSSFGSGHALNIQRFCAELTLSPNDFTIPTTDRNSLLVIVTPLKNKELFEGFTENQSQRICYVKF